MSENSFASRARSSQTNSIQSILEGSNKENAINSASNISEIAKNKFNPTDNTKKNLIHVDPIKKSKSDLVYLVKGVDDGRNAWYYLLVERVKLQLFLRALNDDIIHLENYGVILYSAYGDEPPANITDSLKEEYGIED
jgi:hypothetical protein